MVKKRFLSRFLDAAELAVHMLGLRTKEESSSNHLSEGVSFRNCGGSKGTEVHKAANNLALKEGSTL